MNIAVSLDLRRVQGPRVRSNSLYNGLIGSFQLAGQPYVRWAAAGLDLNQSKSAKLQPAGQWAANTLHESAAVIAKWKPIIRDAYPEQCQVLGP